jgi:beta-lactamase regulating signal transducer with metallopeptidase domain
MTDATTTPALLWLGTYALHSTLLLAGVWLFERLRPDAAPAVRETLWRAAMLTAVLTASLQTSDLVRSPVTISLPVAVRASVHDAQSDVRSDVGSHVEDVNTVPASDAAEPVSLAAEGGAAASASWTWPRVALVLWLVGVLALVLRTAAAAAAACRSLATRTPVAAGTVHTRLRHLARAAGLRHVPRLSEAPGIDGPMTLLSGEICIPAWRWARVPVSHVDAMLAHEMAHAVRRDPLWLLVAIAVHTVFFFQPLNLLARRRLTLLAELAADDWSATRTGNPRALAECLRDLAEAGRRRAVPVFASGMMHGRSALVMRVHRLLDGRCFNGVPSMTIRMLVVVTLAALVSLTPQLSAQDDPAAGRAAQAAQEASQESRSVQVSNGEVSVQVSLRSDGFRLNVDGRGDLDLAPDGTGVARMADGSVLDVTLELDGTSRRVRFEGENSAVTRQFWVSGRPQPWSAAADAFVAEVMPLVLRETGLNAEERVAWLLDNGGHDAVLDEVALIRSDGIQRRYTLVYAESGRVPDPQFARLMRLASGGIGSDGELRRVLVGVHESQRPTDARLEALIRAASTVGSDGEARRVLETVASALTGEAPAAAFLDVAATVGSDGELRRVLLALFARADGSEALLARALDLAGRAIGSDGELRRVLEAVAARVTTDDLARAYAEAVGTVGSDGEARRALVALAEDAVLSPAGWRWLLTAARDVGSDGECARVLLAAAQRLPRDADTIAAYHATLETIGSAGEYRRASEALPRTF